MRLLVACALTGLGLGCSKPEPSESRAPTDSATSEPSRDAATSGAVDSGEFEVGKLDASQEGEAGRDVGGERELLPDFHPDLWTFTPCVDPVEIVVTNPDTFSIPDRTSPNPIRTAAEHRTRFRAGNGNTLLADQALVPGSGWVYDLFSPGGEDVGLYFYTKTDRSEEKRRSQRMMLTVLVDYEPVVADLIRWNGYNGGFGIPSRPCASPGAR